MRIGPYTLRKPWVKLVDVPFDEEIYAAVRSSIIDDIIAEEKVNSKYNIEILNIYRERH
jgi:hypothetical protein